MYVACRRGPYDWSQPGGYYSKVKSGVERLFANNDNKKVILLSFSLGGPVTSAFLSTFVDQVSTFGLRPQNPACKRLSDDIVW